MSQTANQLPNVPEGQKQQQQEQEAKAPGTVQWAKEQYNVQYEKWVPWLEDTFLKYFTRDNKASYAARDNLNKTKITGVEQVDTLQDGVHNLVAGQVGQGGLLQPVGDLASKHGANRAERMGRDERGNYVPGAGGPAAPVADGANAALGGVARGGQQAAGGVKAGVQGLGGRVGLGGK